MKKPNAPLDFLSAYDRPVANLVLGLRDLLFEEAPEAIEKVFASHPSAVWFGFCATTQEPKMTEMFCYIAGRQQAREPGLLPGGASLPDPNHVLEGEGRMRNVKSRMSAI